MSESGASGKTPKFSKRMALRALIQKGLSRSAAGLNDTEVAKFILAETLAEKRRKITKASQGRGADPQHNAAIRRFAREKARALKKEIVASKRSLTLNRSALMRDRAPSPLLDSLDPDRATRWRRIVARRYRSEFPRLKLTSLNFLDDPVGTIESICALSKVDCEEVNAYLDFDDPYCYDIGAFLVVSEVWHQLSPIFRGGRMSAPIQKVLDTVGLGRDLGIRLLGVADHGDIWPFEMRRRRLRGTTQSPTAQLHPQGREQLNDKLVELMDEWLAVASDNALNVPPDVVWELTGEGKSNIANMVGEILDNAERHSSGDGDGDWTMAAFMVKRAQEGQPDAMKCYLAFLSVGRSIAETIEHAPVQTKEFCNRYASQHARVGQSRATLVTIAALQDGVTSAQDAYLNRRGGTGLQESLDLIGALGGAPNPEADARVTIVSGKSCIRLRHPILVGCRDGRNRRVQWCNQSNDPKYPPDRDIAFDLPAHFAGTLVSVAFTLDPGLFVPESEHDG